MVPARELQGKELLFKWLIGMLLVGLMLWMAARALGTAPALKGVIPPALLPPEISEEAAPMTERMPALPLLATPAERVANVLELHRLGELELAVDAWGMLRLPAEVDHWRTLATASALLELGRWEEAAPLLGELLATQPNDPAVHYFTGLLRLEQAARAGEWNDALGTPAARLAAYRPPTVLAHPRSVYELLAMEELEQAIKLAPNLRPEEPLVTGQNGVAETLPRVADLLRVLGAEHLEANAHNVLSELYVQHGQAEHAEQHLDAAVVGGANIGQGYREVGRLYESETRHLDAAHVYAKALHQGDGMFLPAQKVLENLWQGIWNAE